MLGSVLLLDDRRRGTRLGALGLLLGAVGTALLGVVLAVRLALGEAVLERARTARRLRLGGASSGVALLAGGPIVLSALSDTTTP